MKYKSNIPNKSINNLWIFVNFPRAIICYQLFMSLFYYNPIPFLPILQLIIYWYITTGDDTSRCSLMYSRFCGRVCDAIIILLHHLQTYILQLASIKSILTRFGENDCTVDFKGGFVKLSQYIICITFRLNYIYRLIYNWLELVNFYQTWPTYLRKWLYCRFLGSLVIVIARVDNRIFGIDCTARSQWMTAGYIPNIERYFDMILNNPCTSISCKEIMSCLYYH